jgi:hypothetical protein
MNRLLFGDNLKWLRDAKIFPDASVDLVYLDPPFNSNADYNVLFRETSGEASQEIATFGPRQSGLAFPAPCLLPFATDVSIFRGCLCAG